MILLISISQGARIIGVNLCIQLAMDLFKSSCENVKVKTKYGHNSQEAFSAITTQ
jgi:hypothetical protein